MERFFADVIKGARERRGYTQKELAELCGDIQSHVARWESGSFPLAERTVEKVAEGLGLTMRELFAEQLIAEGKMLPSEAPKR